MEHTFPPASRAWGLWGSCAFRARTRAHAREAGLYFPVADPR